MPSTGPVSRRSIDTPNRPRDRAVAQKCHTCRPRVVSLGADHLRADGSCSPLRHDFDDLRALRESGCAPPDEVRSQVQCLFCPAHPGRYALRGTCTVCGRVRPITREQAERATTTTGASLSPGQACRKPTLEWASSRTNSGHRALGPSARRTSRRRPRRRVHSRSRRLKAIRLPEAPQTDPRNQSAAAVEQRSPASGSDLSWVASGAHGAGRARQLYRWRSPCVRVRGLSHSQSLSHRSRTF
jgi:hypothetical protein